MKNKSKHFKIGIFVIGSLIILLVFIFLLGASVLFEKRILVETYFDESVHGLAVGSIVKYRGVSVGSIKSISFVHDEYKLELIVTFPINVVVPDTKRFDNIVALFK